VRHGRLRLIVRDDAPEVAELLRRWAANELPAARTLPGGRGGVGAYQLRPDLAVVLRPYRRGGLMARVTRERYLGMNPRPFRELQVSEALRAHGVPTAEVVGAAVYWTIPGSYRGALATREVPGSANLWQYLQTTTARERGPACAAAANAVRHLHDAGFVHPDLNLQNILVRRVAAEVQAMIIDLDDVRSARVTARTRRAAFDRICRSIRKLDPESAVITLACVEAFQAVAKHAEP
jgi:3-deoxy-D-manno-octulosonic acid kinase